MKTFEQDINRNIEHVLIEFQNIKNKLSSIISMLEFAMREYKIDEHQVSLFYVLLEKLNHLQEKYISKITSTKLD